MKLKKLTLLLSINTFFLLSTNISFGDCDDCQQRCDTDQCSAKYGSCCTENMQNGDCWNSQCFNCCYNQCVQEGECSSFDKPLTIEEIKKTHKKTLKNS